MNICIFGGSFDPPHKAHIMLADYMVSRHDIDKLWLMVSPHNPLKSEPQSSFEERLEMCRLSAEGHPNVIVSEFETTLTPPFYTINTLTALRDKFPEHNFSLLIGGDNVKIISKWKDYRRILDEFTVYAYPRKGITAESSFHEINLVDTKYESNISSSMIRQLIKEGKPVGNFVCPAVEEYIRQKALYLSNS